MVYSTRVFVALILVGLLGIGLSVILYAVISSNDLELSLRYALAMFYPPLGLFGVGLALLIGMPAHGYLSLRGHTTWCAYTATGAVSLFSPYLLLAGLSLVSAAFSNRDDLLPWLQGIAALGGVGLLVLALPGGVPGFLFWLIVRPDRTPTSLKGQE